MRIYQENGSDLRFLSVLARRLPQSRSPLTRFHYKSLLKQQKIKFVSRFTIAIRLIRTLFIVYVFLIHYIDIHQFSRCHRLDLPKFLLPTSVCLWRKSSNEYINQNVFLWYTVACILLGVFMIKTSTIGILEQFLFSTVNLMLLLKRFNILNMRFVESPFLKQMVSSMYLFYILILFFRRGIWYFQILLSTSL